MWICKGCHRRNVIPNALAFAISDGMNDYSLWCDSCHKAAMQSLRRVHQVGCMTSPNVVTATLHVGYLCVEETPEQLERLRRPDSLDVKEPKALSDSLIVLHPVNKTAGVVTGIPPE